MGSGGELWRAETASCFARKQAVIVAFCCLNKGLNQAADLEKVHGGRCACVCMCVCMCVPPEHHVEMSEGTL